MSIVTDNERIMRTALEAIKARITGEWDYPALESFGGLTTTREDCLAIAQEALAKVKGE